jgi:HK97 family phage portal protein
MASKSKPSIFSRALRALLPEKRANYADYMLARGQNYVRLFGDGFSGGSGALEISAVYACTSKIADTIATLDAHVVQYEGDSHGARVMRHDHPAYRMIAKSPNPHIGAYEFWQMLVSDALLYGTGYAFIHRSEGEIYYLPSSRVFYEDDPLTGERFYSYENSPGPIPASDVLEIKAFRGVNPTQQQLQNFTTAKAVQDFGTKFFQNAGMMGGILSTKEHLSVEQMQEAKDMWEREYSGVANAHKMAILGGGFQYQPLTVPLEQLQFLEMRKYTTEEIARVYGVPPAMIGLEGNTAYSNYEQQALQFQQGCILPWVRRIELEIERKLLRDEKNLGCYFDVSTLLRGDTETRAKYYHSLLQDGVFSINEIREKEGYGPVEGGEAHHLQVNMIPLDKMDDFASSVTNNNKTNG